jgi:NAD-dependent SIR2 family protein deacetylase
MSEWFQFHCEDCGRTINSRHPTAMIGKMCRECEGTIRPKTAAQSLMGDPKPARLIGHPPSGYATYEGHRANPCRRRTGG